MISEQPIKMDSLLLAFLQATDEVESESLAADLILHHAEPIIKKVVNHRLSAADLPNNEAQEVQNEAILRLFVRLKDLKANPLDNVIGNFANYTAAVAHRVCHEYWRRKYPERHKLKNRLRYLLNNQKKFALWENKEGRLLCGLAAWHGKSESKIPLLSIMDEEAQKMSLADFLEYFFKHSHEPVELNELVSLVANLFNIQDSQQKFSAESPNLVDRLPTVAENIEKHLEQKQQLQKLWEEICALPAKQRSALLLNLRDEEGRGCIALFQIIGAVTLKQLASAVEMRVEEFVKLWNQLPLEDMIIADLLNLTRQQVINLRKSARERLARRLKNYL